jgi:hypothetical protein
MPPESTDVRNTSRGIHMLASIIEGHATAMHNEHLRDAYIEAVLRLTDIADALANAADAVECVWAVPDEQMAMEWVQ